MTQKLLKTPTLWHKPKSGKNTPNKNRARCLKHLRSQLHPPGIPRKHLLPPYRNLLQTRTQISKNMQNPQPMRRLPLLPIKQRIKKELLHILKLTSPKFTKRTLRRTRISQLKKKPPHLRIRKRTLTPQSTLLGQFEIKNPIRSLSTIQKQMFQTSLKLPLSVYRHPTLSQTKKSMPNILTRLTTLPNVTCIRTPQPTRMQLLLHQTNTPIPCTTLIHQKIPQKIKMLETKRLQLRLLPREEPCHKPKI